jgi:UDP-N-acetylmuramoyl-L-alanyl-D-glutamate--2,6-diaminopimelate ligase
VPAACDFSVLVDYAHTDDALDHALRTVKQLCRNNLTVVFGCGGQRDRGKRPRMAAVAQRWADTIVVTDDNPRMEEPDRIRREILAGFDGSAIDRVTEIPDRRSAIEHALTTAGAGDVVLIAGKGHEDYQILGSEKIDFDDRKIAHDILMELYPSKVKISGS